MKLSNEIKNKFDDLYKKIDFVVELCKTLKQENSGLMLKIQDLESQLDKKSLIEEQSSEQEALIQVKIDGLLEKLNYFSNDIPGDYQSSL
jgi:regulator of replication initiation timing